MPSSPAVTELQVETILFPAEVNPPASTNTLFLGGAGVRGVEIGGNFVKVTTIGVYLEDKALPFLSDKWKGKSGLELNDSVEFFRDIVTGPFEKFIRVTLILPLTGQEFSKKVAENCIAMWKSLGIHTDAEAKAIEKFLHGFRDVNLLPGSSVLYTQLPRGSLAISFAKHDSIPKVSSVIIDNKLLSEALLESIIGKHGVSPNARLSVAMRMSDLLNESHCNGHVGYNAESGKRLTMSSSPAVTELQVETFSFPAFVKPPASNKTLFLGGAGVRGLEIQGKFVKVTTIGVYLEDETVPYLTIKWKGKSSEELNDSIEFFREVVTAPFEKCVRITMILPLSGREFSEKVTENCVAIWKSLGIYTDEESKAIEQFLEVFKDENFASGSSILFTQLWQGFLAVSFAKHDSVPEIANIVIENKLLSEAILESIIGKHGVSPASRRSLATRLSKLLKESHENGY